MQILWGLVCIKIVELFSRSTWAFSFKTELLIAMRVGVRGVVFLYGDVKQNKKFCAFLNHFSIKSIMGFNTKIYFSKHY